MLGPFRRPMITEHQYRRLMTIYSQTGVVSHAAMKADMDRETAARYIKAQAGPEQLKRVHNWRNCPDPLAALWLQAKPWLEASPELEVKALFEHLLGADPALAAPPLAVAVSVLMTFFGLLIPAVALCGAVVVIVDGYSRKAR